MSELLRHSATWKIPNAVWLKAEGWSFFFDFIVGTCHDKIAESKFFDAELRCSCSILRLGRVSNDVSTAFNDGLKTEKVLLPKFVVYRFQDSRYMVFLLCLDRCLTRELNSAYLVLRFEQGTRGRMCFYEWIFENIYFTIFGFLKGKKAVWMMTDVVRASLWLWDGSFCLGWVG